MRVVCVGYRNWALKIYDALAESTKHQFLILRSNEQYDEEAVNFFKPDLVLFYGWSWIISDKIINNFRCVMLHPSALPRYRGGSPIQNQIIDGVTESAVTLFLMTDKVDAGPILQQKIMSLSGTLDEVLDRICFTGIELTKLLLKDDFVPITQNEAEATYCKRREPSDSEVTLHELKTKPAKYLYDKIRMLQKPYPRPYFTTCDGRKLVILGAEIIDK